MSQSSNEVSKVSKKTTSSIPTPLATKTVMFLDRNPACSLESRTLPTPPPPALSLNVPSVWLASAKDNTNLPSSPAPSIPTISGVRLCAVTSTTPASISDLGTETVTSSVVSPTMALNRVGDTAMAGAAETLRLSNVCCHMLPPNAPPSSVMKLALKPAALTYSVAPPAAITAASPLMNTRIVAGEAPSKLSTSTSMRTSRSSFGMPSAKPPLPP